MASLAFSLVRRAISHHCGNTPLGDALEGLLSASSQALRVAAFSVRAPIAPVSTSAVAAAPATLVPSFNVNMPGDAILVVDIDSALQLAAVNAGNIGLVVKIDGVASPGFTWQSAPLPAGVTSAVPLAMRVASLGILSKGTHTVEVDWFVSDAANTVTNDVSHPINVQTSIFSPT